MKSTSKREICASCHKYSEAFICLGCRQPFCAKHVNQHREKIAKDMNNLISNCARLRQDLSSENFAQPLLSNIDKWEKESIEKIRAAARTARADLKPWIDRIKTEFEIPFQKLTEETQSRRKLQDYTEIDLKRWTQQLKELREKLEQRPMIEFIDDNDTRSIHLIQIVDNQGLNPSQDTFGTSPLFEESLENFQESTILERETFGEIFGAITLSEADRVATYSGPWIGDASVCGINVYSSRTHHIHFRVVEKFYNAPFFGIITASQPLIDHILKCPSTNGCSNFDCLVVNGKEERIGRDRLIQLGDVVTLTLDCERRQLFFKHHRTNRLLHLPIDLRLCPFPWKILIVLRRRGDCVRLRGGSYGLSTMDLMAKLSDHFKT